MKPIDDNKDTPPTLIGRTIPVTFRAVYFCDWTEQGTLLANATTNGRDWQLVLYDRRGVLIRKVETAVAPAEGVIASFRKYGHR
jgi:hypothetical protein